MAAARARVTLHRMASLPVVWVDEEEGGTLYAGQVLMLADRIRLEGRCDSCRYLRELESKEIASVHRVAGGGRRGRDRPWLQLRLRVGSGLLISTVLGAATLVELQDALTGILGG